MQFLKIKESARLADISRIVGDRNVEYILSTNDLTRTPRIGEQFYNKCRDAMTTGEVSWQRKSTILNSLTSCSDVFETAALLSSDGWKVLSVLNTLPGTLRIPESIVLPDSTDIIGNGIHIGSLVYRKAMNYLESEPHYIYPEIFNEYSTVKSSRIVDYSTDSGSSPFQYFHIPWGDVTLHSSISNESIDLPCYPEEVEDSRKANYTTMPDLLYTYEPWYLYQSSGPRTNTYSIKFHRDMWTGNHADGKANELIRFFEANCYADYKGSAVNTPIVTLYIKGRVLISGVMESVTTKWDGPILNDGFYADVELTFTITEISKKALNYDVVKSMPLIGG